MRMDKPDLMQVFVELLFAGYLVVQYVGYLLLSVLGCMTLSVGFQYIQGLIL